jgi:CubicO group peptidase (beta-lactamase class C family)
MTEEEAFKKTVSLLETELDKDGNKLRMKSLIVAKGSEQFEHGFIERATKTDLRSVSKVALALTVGAAIDKEVRLGDFALNLGTDVGALLRSSSALSELEGISGWEHVTIAHLLSNTIGHDEGFFFRKDIGNRPADELLPYVFSRPLTREPGTHFSYSNVGPFVISVLFQEFLGKSFSDLAGELILGKIGVTDYEWKRYGEYSAGCSGLELYPDDFHKLALLMANGGRHNGTEIVSADWCEMMKTIAIRTPNMYDPARVFPKFGYGYGLWICENGSYYCDGTNGQYLIVVPDKELVISTLGDQSDMKPITRCMQPLLA